MVIYVTRGLPASGKSTWAKEAAEYPDTVRVCRDDIRDMLVGTDRPGVLSPELEATVSRMEEAAVKAAVDRGMDVVVDAMHLRPKYVDKWCTFGIVTAVSFNAPLEELVRRDARRERPLGEKVIRQIAKRFRIKEDGVLPQITVRNRGFQPYEVDLTCADAYIIDIDGTVADMGGRHSPYSTHDDELMADTPIRSVLEAAWGLYELGNHIIFMSGRSEATRSATTRWLDRHIALGNRAYPYRLLMRGANDKRPDDIVKYELFDKHVRGGYNVLGVFDDRPQVIRMWEKIGLKVFNVGTGEEF